MRITARYDGTCGICGGGFEAGTEIDWTKATRATSHADAAICAAAIEAGNAAEAAEKAAAWKAEKAAMEPSERAYWESVEWNRGHGLCPDGCCGYVTECGDPTCRCVGTGGEGHGEPAHFDEI